MTATTSEYIFQVSGMTCGHCERAVRQAVQTLDAAAQVDVDLPTGRVRVRTSAASQAAIATAIEAEGYNATPSA